MSYIMISPNIVIIIININSCNVNGCKCWKFNEDQWHRDLDGILWFNIYLSTFVLINLLLYNFCHIVKWFLDFRIGSLKLWLVICEQISLMKPSAYFFFNFWALIHLVWLKRKKLKSRGFHCICIEFGPRFGHYINQWLSGKLISFSHY